MSDRISLVSLVSYDSFLLKELVSLYPLSNLPSGNLLTSNHLKTLIEKRANKQKVLPQRYWKSDGGIKGLYIWVEKKMDNEFVTSPGFIFMALKWIPSCCNHRLWQHCSETFSDFLFFTELHFKTTWSVSKCLEKLILPNSYSSSYCSVR